MKSLCILWQRYWLITLIVVVGFVLRLLAIQKFDFISDNGTELYVVEQMKNGMCWPLVGPLLGVENVFIPPTYFYILYFLEQIAPQPLQLVIFFAVSNSLALLFLSLAVWSVTDKRAGILTALVVSFSYAVFMEGTYIWHPQPVSMLFTLGLWLVLLARKNSKSYYLYSGLVSYVLALSVHPSPLPIAPFFLAQTILFYWKNSHLKFAIAVVRALLIFLIIGLPIYASQLYFEFSSGFPTLNTIFLKPDLAQPAYVAGLVEYENVVTIVRYFVTRNLGIATTVTDSYIELVGWLILTGVLISVSFWHKSWRWASFFPYSLIAALIILGLFYDRELLFWSANHRYMPTLLFLFFSLAEVWYRLRSNILAQAIVVVMLLLFLQQNTGAFARRWQQLQQTNIPESYHYKQKLISRLKTHLLTNNYSLAETLILHKNFAATSYDDHVTLQYYAMEYWALGNFEFLTPPINYSCNQFKFFDRSQLAHNAKQIVLIEQKHNLAPKVLFTHYLPVQVVDVDDQTKLVVYEATACYP